MAFASSDLLHPHPHNVPYGFTCLTKARRGYGVSMFRVYDITDNLGLLSTPAGLHPCQGSYKPLNLPTHPEHKAGIQAYQSLWLVA